MSVGDFFNSSPGQQSSFHRKLQLCSIDPAPIEFQEKVKNNDALSSFRKSISISLSNYFDKEQRALIMGLVLGANELYYLPQFSQALRDTGTIHVVVVSGFNISLVASMLLRVLKRKGGYSLYVIVLFTFFYSVLTGFEPPVVRAWVMASLSLLITSFGRNVSGMELLLVSGLIMLVFYPGYLFSLSFQLSFIATFGLIYFDPVVSTLFSLQKFFPRTSSNVLQGLDNSVVLQDLRATFSAQVFVLPLLALYFGNISLLGFFVNPLVLWIIPWGTILGFVFVILLSLKVRFLLLLLSFPLKVLTTLFISTIYRLSTYSSINLNFLPDIKVVIFYYFCLLLIPKIFVKNTPSTN